MSYYAVASGRKVGIFTTWDECKKSIDGYSGAKFKKFTNIEEAKFFMGNDTQPIGKSKQEKAIDYYVYTDGSCYNNGGLDPIAGIGIYFGENDERNSALRLEGKKITNNVAELMALITLYNIIHNDIIEGKRICIVTDSLYSIRCATTYGEKCDKKNWKYDIPNKKLVRKLYLLYRDKENVSFQHIMAHTMNTDIHSVGNMNADKLAKEGCLFTDKG
jgi:ribonuclease HI